MEPFGSYVRRLPLPAGLGVGALAVLTATGLLELSRTLAEAARGRWYAGNGRDVFHAGAVAALGVAYFLNGLPPALAFVAASLAALLPLVLIDRLPPRRPARVAILLALFALASAPPLLEPRAIVDASNAAARVLFR